MSTSRASAPLAAWFVALASGLAPAALPAQTAEASYDRVAKAWASQQSLEAQFTQQITNPLLGRTASSRGVFRQQRPNKVSITFTDPVGDRIVGDGTSLWVYLPSSAPGQVLKLPADADGAIVADLLGQLLEAPRKAFALSGGEAVVIDGRSTRRIQLVPKSPGSVPFQRAQLWLDDRDPRPIRVQVIDPQGVDRTITLTTWIPEASLPRDAFTFRPPKGTKVIKKLPG